MPRSREFDPDKVVDKALELFLRKGYADTSMRDLVEYTGVAHAGLYSAFGNKQELYEAVLRRYNERLISWLLEPLEQSESNRADVEHFFEQVLNIVKDPKFNGCIIVNTAVEFVQPIPLPIRLAITKHMDRMVSAFQGALGRAREQGQIREDLDPNAVADYFVTVFNGVTVAARGNLPYKMMENTIHVALQLLD